MFSSCPVLLASSPDIPCAHSSQVDTSTPRSISFQLGKSSRSSQSPGAGSQWPKLGHKAVPEAVTESFWSGLTIVPTPRTIGWVSPGEATLSGNGHRTKINGIIRKREWMLAKPTQQTSVTEASLQEGAVSFGSRSAREGHGHACPLLPELGSGSSAGLGFLHLEFFTV